MKPRAFSKEIYPENDKFMIFIITSSRYWFSNKHSLFLQIFYMLLP
jgi:hypothetical protein